MASFCWHSYRLLKAAARNSRGRWTGHATTDRVSIPSYLAFVDAGWTACARVVPGWLHGPFEAVLIMIVKNTVASVRAFNQGRVGANRHDNNGFTETETDLVLGF